MAKLTPIVGLFVYPARPPEIRTAITFANERLRKSGRFHLSTWEENDIAGRFLVDPILEKIESSEIVVADITTLNFNVVYEAGYTLGAGKRLVLVRNTAIKSSDEQVREIGIFDTLGYSTYSSSEDLERIVNEMSDRAGIVLGSSINRQAPIYLLLPKVKTDNEIHLIARIKKARIPFRSYDPEEHGRLPAREAIDNVSQSHGVVVPLLPEYRSDALVHNVRAAFVAGLAQAMRKGLLLLQQGDDPVPLDYRDLVASVKFPSQIDEHVAEFSANVASRLVQGADLGIRVPGTLLARLNLGASSAENELSEIGHYYLETDEYHRASRGEVQIVAGRKGSGKTALFAQLRNRLRGGVKLSFWTSGPKGISLYLLWYGVLGLEREPGEATYIYDVAYDMRRLKAMLRNRGSDAALRLNPAFWKGLEAKD